MLTFGRNRSSLECQSVSIILVKVGIDQLSFINKLHISAIIINLFCVPQVVCLVLNMMSTIFLLSPMAMEGKHCLSFYLSDVYFTSLLWKDVERVGASHPS